MWNRVAIFVIAISQFLLSLVSLGVAMAGGLSPALVAYGIWGMVSACLLPCAGALSRAGALVWHLMFVPYVFVAYALTNWSPPDNQNDKIIMVWAVLDLAAIFYLAKTTLHSFRNRPKSEP